jgi:hypothetical protein
MILEAVASRQVLRLKAQRNYPEDQLAVREIIAALKTAARNSEHAGLSTTALASRRSARRRPISTPLRLSRRNRPTSRSRTRNADRAAEQATRRHGNS